MTKRKLSVRTIRTKVYGISNYQAAAESVRAGDELTLCREPENKHDPNAIGIVTRRGQLLGYINRDIAEDLSPKIDDGRLGGICIASDITGGGERTTGVNLLLVVGPIETPDDDFYDLAASELDVKIRLARTPKPRDPILASFIIYIASGLGSTIATAGRQLKSLVLAMSRTLGMSPALVSVIILVTLAVAVGLAVLLSR